MFEHVVPPPKIAYGSEDTAGDLLEAFHLPADAIRVLQVRRLIAAQPHFGNALVQAEAAQFLDRVRTSGWSVATELKPQLTEGPATTPDTRPRVRWIREYVPRVIPPGHSFTANVRFRNSGTIRLRHTPPGNFVLAVRWLHADGRPLDDAPDVRTPLPLDIAPGRELTFPMQIEAPRNEGRYRLRLIMVEEGVSWMEADALDIRVTLRPVHWPEGTCRVAVRSRNATGLRRRSRAQSGHHAKMADKPRRAIASSAGDWRQRLSGGSRDRG